MIARFLLAAALSAQLALPAAAQSDGSSDKKPCQPWPRCVLSGDKPVINPGLPGDPSTPGIREDRRPQTFQAPSLLKGG